MAQLILTHRESHHKVELLDCACACPWCGEADADSERKLTGVFSPKLSRILPPKGAVSPCPAWLKKFEPTVIQNPMTIRRFFILVIEKYLGKEFKEMRTD
ncbi:hypothetical protein AVEN_208965-1 [Araneus ventricosus]|uniref:Uncharacterized protein n=1 Tax=Araneus ventricosus TaxID=182803 RepID=A0A4Y2CPJ3_ARAVE|nr:hypothetical protein AVEN_208965-1 [Araneus ventricosus]